MNGKKVVVIIGVLIALCAILYLRLPSSQDTGTPPETTTSTITKQRAKNAGERPKSAAAKPRKQRVRDISEDNLTTSAEEQPGETPRQVPREITRPAAAPAPATADENATPKEQDLKTLQYEKRMQEFKEKYEWDEPATMNMAEHLIGVIPKQFRDSGITAMMKNFDEAQQQGGPGTVDELMLMQSAEKMMPEEFKPQLQQIIEKYKADNPGGRR